MLAIWILFIIGAAAVAHAKGKSAVLWGILGFCFGPFALLIVALMKAEPGHSAAARVGITPPPAMPQARPAPPATPRPTPAPRPAPAAAPAPAPKPIPAAAQKVASVTVPALADAAKSKAKEWKEMPTGDAILKGLSIVTLNSWAMKGMSKAFMIPELADAVAAAPHDPGARVRLGVRLQEMERLSSRIKRSVAPGSGTALLLRPVTRAASKTAVKMLQSDSRKPSEKVLESAYQAATAALQRQPRNPEALDTLARVYQATGHFGKAVEVARTSIEADPNRSDPYFIAADACFASGDNRTGGQWAQAAISRGSTLARALVDPKTGSLREEFASTKSSMMNMPTTMKYWDKKRKYLAPADPAEVDRFYGPSSVTAN